VRFYLVAILFIVFDLEAAFLFPWAVSLKEIGWAGWITMMIFIAELVAGLIYAWKSRGIGLGMNQMTAPAASGDRASPTRRSSTISTPR
jgi:hypothetical protein